MDRCGGRAFTRRQGERIFTHRLSTSDRQRLLTDPRSESRAEFMDDVVEGHGDLVGEWREIERLVQEHAKRFANRAPGAKPQKGPAGPRETRGFCLLVTNDFVATLADCAAPARIEVLRPA